MKKNLWTDILEHLSGWKTSELVQLEDSKKTKNAIPKVLCGTFFFSFFLSSYQLFL